MRAVRALCGLILVLAAMPLLLGSAFGWVLMQHRDDTGAFTAQLEPVRTNGFAIVVPDVATVVGRHPAANVLGSGRLRLTIVSSERPIMAALIPSAEAARYLSGVARSDVADVGYASDAQPVRLVEVAGTAEPAVWPSDGTWASSNQDRASVERTIQWSTSSGSATPLSLVVMRADRQAGIDLSIAASFAPGWLNAGTWGLLLVGCAALIAGSALLFRFAPAEVRLVLEPDQALDMADRIADRLTGAPAWGNGSGGHSGEFRLVPYGGMIPASRDAMDEPTGESPYLYTAT